MDEYVVALSRLVKSETHAKEFDHLYGNLTILDGKSASLLQYNSILIAVSSFNLTFDVDKVKGTHAILFASFVVVMLSAFILLSVVWVHWSTVIELRNEKWHLRRLIKLRDTRTVRFRMAWYLSFLGMTLILLYSSMKFATLPVGGFNGPS